MILVYENVAEVKVVLKDRSIYYKRLIRLTPKRNSVNDVVAVVSCKVVSE